MTFKNSMEVLQHVTKQHSKYIIPYISVKEKELQAYQHEEEIPGNYDNIDLRTQFKSFKCQEIVFFTDIFNDDLEEKQLNRYIAWAGQPRSWNLERGQKITSFQSS